MMEARQLMGDPDSDDTQAPLLLGLSGGVLLLALLLLFIRLVSRLRPARVLKSEDWVISVAAVLAIVNFILLTFACSFGLGRRAKFVSAANRSITLRLVFTAQLSFYWALSFVKISVALLLLRFKSTPRWRGFLYFTIGILVLTTIAQTLFQVLQCQPFSVYWDPSVASRVKCVPMPLIIGMIVANSTVHVTTDILFSLMPICFIRKLNRPRNEKIFLGILMGLGLFASTFAILRTAGLKNFGASGDFFKDNVMATLWANMELEIAMIAATMPTLKSFMESALVKVGTKFYEKNTESQIRGRLVHMGFLAEDEAMSDGGEYGPEKTQKILHVEKVIAGLDGTARVPKKDRKKREKRPRRDVGLDKCRDPD